MKKWAFIIPTAIIMIIVSRFAIRIVDATVQIDGNAVILAVLLLIVNIVIGLISFALYKKL